MAYYKAKRENMEYKKEEVKIINIFVTTKDGNLTTQVWGLGDDNGVYFYEPSDQQWRPFT